MQNQTIVLQMHGLLIIWLTLGTILENLHKQIIYLFFTHSLIHSFHQKVFCSLFCTLKDTVYKKQKESLLYLELTVLELIHISNKFYNKCDQYFIIIFMSYVITWDIAENAKLVKEIRDNLMEEVISKLEQKIRAREKVGKRVRNQVHRDPCKA